MRILVDHQIFVMQEYGGISRYHTSINAYINQLQNTDVSNIIHVGCRNIYIPNCYSSLQILNSHEKGKKVLNVINKSIVRNKISKFEVFHPTFYSTYFLRFNKLPPFVVTIHDLIPELYFPIEMEGVVINKKKIIQRASAIIAISEATKRELLKFYPDIDEDKVHVVYHGYPKNFELNINRNEAFDEVAGYLLFVGLRGGYKNFLPFLEEVRPFLIKNNIQLKVVGPSVTLDEVQVIEEFGLTELVSFETKVPDSKMYTYYRNALAFVYPSLAEGFGMPILEAFISECPVVCSDIAVFREVAGDAALYFDINGSSNINKVLENLLQDPDLRTRLINSGKQQVKKFQWEESALKTLDVYRKII